jgi:hypothetical protein
MMRSESEFTEFKNFQNVVWFCLFDNFGDFDSASQELIIL